MGPRFGIRFRCLRCATVTVLLLPLGCQSPEFAGLPPGDYGTVVRLTEVPKEGRRAELFEGHPEGSRTERPGTVITMIGFVETREVLGLPARLLPAEGDAVEAALPIDRIAAVAGGTVLDPGWAPDDPAALRARAEAFRFGGPRVECSDVEDPQRLEPLLLGPENPPELGNITVMARLAEDEALVGIDARTYVRARFGATLRPATALEASGVQAHAAAVDAEGSVWLGGNQNGLWRWDPRTDQVERITTGTVAVERIDALVAGGASSPPEVWAVGREHLPEPGPIRTYALRLDWGGGPHWVRYPLLNNGAAIANLDLAWLGPGHVYFATEARAYFELDLARGLTIPVARLFPNPAFTITSVLVTDDEVHLGLSGASGFLGSRPRDQPDAWSTPTDSHPVRLLRMVPWARGVATAGGGGWIDVTRPVPGGGRIFCGQRVKDGRDDLDEIIAMTPEEVWFGGKLAPSRIPQIYRLRLRP